MRLAIYRFSYILCFWLATQAGRGVVAQNSTAPEVSLHLSGALVSGNSIKIGYEIPYDGYIEFYLFNKEGERIWYSSFVKQKGTYYLAVNRTKMELNTVYLYDFWYKGKKYSGSFKNS